METIPRSIKLDAIVLGLKGFKQPEIKDTLGISISVIQRAKYKQRDHGDIEGGAKKRGPKPKMSADLEDVNLSRPN
jgi:transposase